MLGKTSLLKSTSCIILNDLEFELSVLSLRSPLENCIGFRKLLICSVNQSDGFLSLAVSSNGIEARFKC